MIDPSGRPSFSPVRKSYTIQAENQLRERITMLQKEFSDIDVNHDDWISREELYSYLDRKAGKTFDRTIADDIFDQMDKDHDNKVIVSEFIKVYIQADEILRAKIDKARLMRETFKKEEEELKIKAQQAASHEGFGAPQSGLANVNVKEARLAPELARFSNLFVEVYLNHHPVARTRVISAENALTWDEKFAFEVPNPQSEIKFVLFDRGVFGGFGGATALGEARVNVSELSDQEPHSAWVNLLKKEGQTPAGHLSLELQWIYSKAKYFHTLAHKSHERAEKADEDVRDYESMLVRLHEPFTGMQTAHQAFDVQSKYPGINTRDQQFVSGMNKLASKFGHEGQTNEQVWSKITINIAALEAVIGILLMFGRGSFFDVLFPVIVFLYIKQGSLKETISLRIVAFGFILSVLVQDLLWALIFWEDWGLNEYMALDLPSHQMTFIILLTIISMGVKVLLAILCYMLNIETSMHRGSVKRNMMRNVDYPIGQVTPQNTIL